MTWRVPEKYRVQQGTFGTTNEPFGAFVIPYPNDRRKGERVTLYAIASNGLEPDQPDEWQHVSVHASVVSLVKGDYDRAPTWDEMCFVKDLFWDKQDCVVQYHPPQSDYINRHPYTLHLWKFNGEFPMPPKEYV
jgi:hypothetical protein